MNERVEASPLQRFAQFMLEVQRGVAVVAHVMSEVVEAVVTSPFVQNCVRVAYEIGCALEPVRRRLLVGMAYLQTSPEMEDVRQAMFHFYVRFEKAKFRLIVWAEYMNRTYPRFSENPKEVLQCLYLLHWVKRARSGTDLSEMVCVAEKHFGLPSLGVEHIGVFWEKLAVGVYVRNRDPFTFVHREMKNHIQRPRQRKEAKNLSWDNVQDTALLYGLNSDSEGLYPTRAAEFEHDLARLELPKLEMQVMEGRRRGVTREEMPEYLGTQPSSTHTAWRNVSRNKDFIKEHIYGGH